MQQWLIVALAIISGLFIAWSTYIAGLRFYATAIGVSGSLGYLLVGFGFHWPGWPLIACSALLIFFSRKTMRAHKIGPFATLGNKPTS